MIKAIIFDLDGTLLNTQATTEPTLRLFSQAKGLPSYDVTKMLTHYWEPDTVDLGWGIPLHQQKNMLDEWADWVKVNMQTNLELCPDLFEGVYVLLQKLSNKMPVGIATSRESTAAEFFLHRHNANEFFSFRRTQCCVKKFGLKDKPAPDMLLHLMAEHGLDAHDIIMVGDTTADIGMAQGAGVKNIAISHGMHNVAKLQAANPDYLVHNVPELEALLDRLLG